MTSDPNAAKYQIRARITAEGVIDKPDVVGAVFGQTEGLLGDELDLRDLQKSGRIGRIEVEIDSRKGKSEGEVIIPSSLDQVETAIVASGLETVDRIGPCRAKIEVVSVEDIRISKRQKVVERAKVILGRLQEDSKGVGIDLTEAVRAAVQVEEITTYGPEHLPAGPNIDQADALIVVEGRSDVLNLLRCGIKNVIAVEGTSVPQTVKDLSRGKTVTVFTDGDRAGELILREMLQTMDIDFVARAPRGSEVEELTQKQLLKCLRNKIPINQYLEMSGFESTGATREPRDERPESSGRPERRDDREGPGGGRRDDRDRAPSRPPPMPALAAAPPSIPMTPELGHYFELLNGVENASRCLFVGDDDAVVGEAPVKEMIEAIGQLATPAKAVVFDGIVSQRLLDAVQEKGIGTVVGTRLGPIGKFPDQVKIYTRADLQPGPPPR
ncbi:MAG TPA: DNA primase DnaG [Thermoplasmata archaeon]|nr:DNA primase DnaG [Thermoplasmata archaeon]